MANRLDLHEELCEVLGSRNVYFQPPATVKMSYPAIRYSRADIDNQHADDGVYMQHRAYELIVIDPDPDSSIVERVAKLPRCRWNRSYPANNLNHDVFTIYY